MKKYHYKIDIAGNNAPAKLLGAIERNSRVLEVGCGSGMQTRVLTKDLGCSVTGIEIDANAAEEARQFCDQLVIANVDDLDFEQALGGRQYDVVLLADVLEHLKDPARALKRTKGFLVQGGFVLASIPNVVHAALVLEMVHGRFDYRPYGLLDDTHIRFFTKKGIFKLFEDCDLAITDIDRVRLLPEKTEFFTHEYGAGDEAVLEYIRSQNPEWNTFQFVVKAVPTTSEMVLQGHALLELEDRLKNAEISNAVLAKRNRKLQNELDWLARKPIYQIYSRLKGLFR
jgi:2-polyprenyl-3-methyl-5-hydroxy-6-metoxy-1,4-benzoquinol methylase